MKKKLCSVWMVMLAALMLCSALAEAAEDPVVVRVGEFTYSQSVVQGSLNSDLELSQLLNTAALRYYQLEKLNSLIEEWQADYDIETHPELLKY